MSSFKTKFPKRPTLNFLKGNTVLSSHLRNALEIGEGILTGEVKNWSVMELLVKDYFEHITEYNDKGEELYTETIATLRKLRNIELIDEGCRKQRKDGSSRISSIRNKSVLIPQGTLFLSYCASIESYISNSAVKNHFLFQYVKMVESKRREREKRRQQAEEEQATEKMLHDGKMVAFLAVESGSSELRHNLQVKISEEAKRKREKGKGKEKAEEKQEEDDYNEDNNEDEDEDNERRRRKVRVVSPVPVNDISFTSTSSNDWLYEYQSEIGSPTLPYIKSFDELSPISMDNLTSLEYMPMNMSMADRLSLSSVEFIDTTAEACFVPVPLSDHITLMVSKFVRAVEYGTKDMLLVPTSIEHINVVSLLNTSLFNIFKESNVSRYNYHMYKKPGELANMENDFKIKYVVPFINAAFNINDKLVVYWDAPLKIYDNSDMGIQKRQTTDIEFKTVDGMEVGIAEVKPFNAPEEKLEEDRIRLAEISKKILHRRILAAKSERELVVFGIMIAGSNVEYYTHTYDSKDGSAKYTFRLLKKSILPTLPDTFSHMLLSLESLLHYKGLMVQSLASDLEVEKPYAYSDSHRQFEPTVTLLKL